MEVTPGAKSHYGNKKALRLRLRAFVICLRSALGALYFLRADNIRYAERPEGLCEEACFRVVYHSAYPSVLGHSTPALQNLALLFLFNLYTSNTRMGAPYLAAFFAGRCGIPRSLLLNRRCQGARYALVCGRKKFNELPVDLHRIVEARRAGQPNVSPARKGWVS